VELEGISHTLLRGSGDNRTRARFSGRLDTWCCGVSLCLGYTRCCEKPMLGTWLGSWLGRSATCVGVHHGIWQSAADCSKHQLACPRPKVLCHIQYMHLGLQTCSLALLLSDADAVQSAQALLTLGKAHPGFATRAVWLFRVPACVPASRECSVHMYTTMEPAGQGVTGSHMCVGCTTQCAAWVWARSVAAQLG
jgi:hypothetical protein